MAEPTISEGTRCSDNVGGTFVIDLRKRRSAQRPTVLRQLLPGPGGHQRSPARGPAEQRRCCCGAAGSLKHSAPCPDHSRHEPSGLRCAHCLLGAGATGRRVRRTARRDTAIIMLFLDGGLRLSELAGLQVADVDLRDRIVFVAGKASRRSGPRHRAVPLGVKAARALDRYLRERRQHPYVDTLRLWLGSRGRPTAIDGRDHESNDPSLTCGSTRQHLSRMSSRAGGIGRRGARCRPPASAWITPCG